MDPFTPGSVNFSAERLARIAQARNLVMRDGGELAPGGLEPWIERSWRRCLQRGQRPDHRVVFDLVTEQAQARARQASAGLLAAARPVMGEVARALASTQYFAILTNAQGVVVNVDGQLDRQDPRATSIARVGVDLSESAVGTTAIGAALSECAPVWLHRGEHFFGDNGVYSCAGAPIFSPNGQCAGMLDFTGVAVPERYELLSLAVHAARRIEVGMLAAVPHSLLLQLSWPGDVSASTYTQGASTFGLLAVDTDGCVVGADTTARNMLGLRAQAAAPSLDSIFAISSATLWDAAREPDRPLEVPLWSGLRVHVRGSRRSGTPLPIAPIAANTPVLRDMENSAIRKAVADARGNVAQAAKALGISRATVYRKLAQKARKLN
jgi:sigma-54 dependent transcriptional regulator, acetoin dehydrogenase operon transcriptional activator AcoR